MSTYYYMVCNKHREICDACTRTAGGMGHLDDSEKILIPFMITHADCGATVMSEYALDDTDIEDTYTWWTSQNVEELYNKLRGPL